MDNIDPSGRGLPAEELDRLLAAAPRIDVERWHRDMERLGNDRLTLPGERDDRPNGA